MEKYARSTDEGVFLDHHMILLLAFIVARSPDGKKGIEDRRAVEKVQERYLGMLNR